MALFLGHALVMALAAPAVHPGQLTGHQSAHHSHQHGAPSGAALYELHTACGSFEAVRTSDTIVIDVDAVARIPATALAYDSTLPHPCFETSEPGASPSQLRAQVQVYLI